jgi:hypothetical protein
MRTAPALYEISGDGWSASFQRWVLGGVSADVSPHRGALPCYILEGSEQGLRVVVALPQTEAVWIAFTLGPGVVVLGETSDRRACNKSLLAELKGGWRIEIVDAVLDESGIGQPIGEASVGVARSAQELNRPQLVFRITAAGDVEASLSVALAIPDLYSLVSGEPAPSPSSPDDAYGGWRLP